LQANCPVAKGSRHRCGENAGFGQSTKITKFTVSAIWKKRDLGGNRFDVAPIDRLATLGRLDSASGSAGDQYAWILLGRLGRQGRHFVFMADLGYMAKTLAVRAALALVVRRQSDGAGVSFISIAKERVGFICTVVDWVAIFNTNL
jgi:hypothetical protein